MASYIGSASSPADNGTGTTEPVSVNPTAITMAAGDLIYALAAMNYSGGPSDIVIGNAGGQLWRPQTLTVWSSSTRAYRVFVAFFNGTWAANPTFDGSGTTLQAAQAVLHAFRPTAGYSWIPVPDVVEVTATPSGSGGATHTAATVAASAERRLVLFSFGVDGDTLTTSSPTFTIAGSNQYRNTSNAGLNHSTQYRIQTAAAASGTCAVTWSGAAAGTCKSIAYREEPMRIRNASSTRRTIPRPLQ